MQGPGDRIPGEPGGAAAPAALRVPVQVQVPVGAGELASELRWKCSFLRHRFYSSLMHIHQNGSRQYANQNASAYALMFALTLSLLVCVCC